MIEHVLLVYIIHFENAQGRTTASKFISAILVFLCLGHTITKEIQTNSEQLQDFISESQSFM